MPARNADQGARLVVRRLAASAAAALALLLLPHCHGDCTSSTPPTDCGGVDGELDKLFGVDGIAVLDTPEPDEGAHAIAVDSQGRIVLAGKGLPSRDPVIWRLTADGSLDPTFNGQGWAVLPGGGAEEGYRGMTLDSFDRIIGAGRWLGSGFDMLVVRYDTDGSLDPTFNGTGWTTHHNASGGAGHDEGYDVTVDIFGRVVVSGYSRGTVGMLDDPMGGSGTGRYDMTVWRYLDGGTLDPSFNGTGFVTHHNAAGGGGMDIGTGVRIDLLGRIVVGGLSYGTRWDVAVWRLEDDGSFDTSFNGQGWTSHNDAGGANEWDAGSEIALDDQGRILVAGITDSTPGGLFGIGYGPLDMAIWRFETDGSLDRTFNGQGWVTHDNAGGGLLHDSASGITVDSCGRIVATGGSTGPSGVPIMVLWRYQANGSLDASLGGQGWVTQDPASSGANGQGVAEDHLGRLLVGGASTLSGGALHATAWRFGVGPGE